MSEEMENKPVQSAEENGNSREGRPSVGHAGYQSDYNASARQQRPRIRTTRAYSSERGNNGEGGSGRLWRRTTEWFSAASTKQLPSKI